MKLFKQVYYFFFKPSYRYPTREEIESVDFEYHDTLKDLLLYDQGKLKKVDSLTARPGSLRKYCQKRGFLQPQFQQKM